EIERPLAQRLLSIAREADPHPFRDRLRTAVAATDVPALKQLAREAATQDLPVSTALLLADGLHRCGELDLAIPLLRQARERHPDDFWVNDILGVYLNGSEPTRSDEAARCFAAAIALRPRAYFVHTNLGVALAYQCRWKEAMAALETSLALKSDF